MNLSVSRNVSLLTDNVLTNSSCLSLDVNFDHVGYFYLVNVITLVINVVFALVGVAANSLIIYVIWRTTPLHSPSNVLLACLALADFLVALLAQPAFAVHKIGEMENNFQMYCVTRVMSEIVGISCVGVSILTLAAISIERLLALKLHLRYKEIVTTQRVLQVTGIFWFLVIAVNSARFVMGDDRIYLYGFMLPVLMMSLLVTFVAYIQIFRCVLRHQAQIASNVQPSNSRKGTKVFNVLKYKKSALTMSIILGLFLLFNLPVMGVLFARRMLGYTSEVKVAFVVTSTLVYLNSSVNPLVYCWRISDIRSAVKRTLRRMISRDDPSGFTDYEGSHYWTGSQARSRVDASEPGSEAPRRTSTRVQNGN